MTVTIINKTKAFTSFEDYLDAFDSDFALYGFGAFSDENDSGGDYMGSEAEVTDTPDTALQAFEMSGNLAYDITTHRLGGRADGVTFGHGGWLDSDAHELEFAQVDFDIAFGTPIENDDAARAILVGLMGNPVNGGDPTDALRDYIAGQSIVFKGKGGADVFSGGAHDDKLRGGRGADELFGGDGDDKLFGGKGKDVLDGGAGKDVLKGGKGDDQLIASAGKDKMIGGAGDDVFDFSHDFGKGVVKDFTIGEDVLKLSANDFADLDAVLDAATQKGDNLLIDSDFGMIKLRDIDMDDLSASDFMFA